MYFGREAVQSFIDSHVIVEEPAKILKIDEVVRRSGRAMAACSLFSALAQASYTAICSGARRRSG